MTWNEKLIRNLKMTLFSVATLKHSFLIRDLGNDHTRGVCVNWGKREQKAEGRRISVVRSPQPTPVHL